jgi:membrane protein implicated in regulation of membrane protease activity
MKKLILASLALLLICSAIPVMAGEKAIDSQEPATFQALSKLSGPGQVVLSKMSDEQLSKVEGEGWRFISQKNISYVNANNYVFACVVCKVGSNVYVYQNNSN